MHAEDNACRNNALSAKFANYLEGCRRLFRTVCNITIEKE